MNLEAFKNTVFQCSSKTEFHELALSLFQWQARHVSPYAQFLRLLKVDPSTITHISEIPFLPVTFFKSHNVLADGFTPQLHFTSSGTTGQTPSRHPVADRSLYKTSYLEGFKHFYGDPKEYVFLALLPSYLERTGSSLIDMAAGLITESQHPDSGFFLNNLDQLIRQIKKPRTDQRKIFLLGVSFALLDLAADHQIDLPKGAIVMETGGMKGRRKEMVRTELHDLLCRGFGMDQIHSEYGMTELLSQSYAPESGRFLTPPWMKITLRDTEDPLSPAKPGKTGGINIIDLANVYSCAFIATQDLGRPHPSGGFEVLGRFDDAEVRGCNLMVV